MLRYKVRNSYSSRYIITAIKPSLVRCTGHEAPVGLLSGLWLFDDMNEVRKCYGILLQNHEKKKPLWTARRRYDIEIDNKEIGCEEFDWT